MSINSLEQNMGAEMPNTRGLQSSSSTGFFEEISLELPYYEGEVPHILARRRPIAITFLAGV